MIELAKCVSPRKDGVVCGQPAAYQCEQEHLLCPNHAMRLGGLQKRRKTDRRCSVCQSVKIRSLKRSLVALDRRYDAEAAVRSAETILKTSRAPKPEENR